MKEWFENDFWLISLLESEPYKDCTKCHPEGSFQVHRNFASLTNGKAKYDEVNQC